MKITRLYTTADSEVRRLSQEISASQLRSADMQQFLCVDLPAAMEQYDGIGIAAVQAGYPVQAFVVHKGYVPGASEHLIVVNPRLGSESDRTAVMEEGCLSVPGVFGLVDRPAKVRLKGVAPDGSSIDIKAKGMLAKILQHEYDHLYGTLFIDKVLEN